MKESFSLCSVQMAHVGSTKILKQGGEKLDKFEESVSQVKLCVRVVCRAAAVNYSTLMSRLRVGS